MNEVDLLEELRLARANLKEANEELAGLREENANLVTQAQMSQENAHAAFAQLKMMRNSFTWQVTAPLRMLLDRLCL